MKKKQIYHFFSEHGVCPPTVWCSLVSHL